MVIRINAWKCYGVSLTCILLAVLLWQFNEKISFPVFYQQLAYKEYTFDQSGFKASFPATTQIQSEFWGGEDIQHNVRFFDPKYRYHGLVQKWKIENLRAFIERNKLHTQKLQKYSRKSVIVSGRRGYLIEYIQKTNSGTTYVAMDMFLEGDSGTAYRIVYYVAEELMEEDHRKNFLHIVQTFDKTL